MSVTVFGIYESTDAAELAAHRIRSILPGVRIKGVSKRVERDQDATDQFILPLYGQYGGITSINANFNAVGLGLFNRETRPDNETYMRDDASLQIEAPDERTAQRTAALMHSTGGMQVHEVGSGRGRR